MDSQDKLPLVSVITPSFNQGGFIEETIRSVLAQDYPNIEHIVIDGASTDGTVEVLKRFEGKIFWISEPDRGQSDAINKGIGRARGEIIAWLCADDLYQTDTVTTVVDYFTAHRASDMVYGECQYIDCQGTPIGRYPTRDFDIAALLPFCFIPQPTAFLRKAILARAGGLDAGLQFAMDLDLWARVAMIGRIDFMPQILARYRLHEGTKTVSSSSAAEREGIRVRERYLKDPLFKKSLGSAYRRASSVVYLKTASFFFYEGDSARTFQYLAKAVAACPGNRQIWSLPFCAWPAIQKRRNRRQAGQSADRRIELLIGNRSAR